MYPMEPAPYILKTTGDKATRIARRMVVDLGMSKLGPVYFGPQLESAEWGRTWIEPTQLSPDMQGAVDREIKRIVDECFQKALEIIKKNRKKLDKVAEALLKKETLEQEEFEKLVKGGVRKKKTAKVSKSQTSKIDFF